MTSERRVHCMVVHARFPLGEPRVERQVAQLVKAGWQVDVFALRADGEAPREVVDGVTVHRLPARRHKGSGRLVQLLEYVWFFLLAALALSHPARWRRYRVVQVHNLPDPLVFAAIVPKLCGARVILDLHDLTPEFYASRFPASGDGWPRRLLELQEAAACRFADCVITVTEYWRRTLVRRGISSRKTFVVMNLPDDRIFHRRGGVRANGHVPDRFSLIYHGQLTHRYGVDLAICAIDKVRHEVPCVHLTVHGRGEAAADLHRLTRERGLQAHVTFSGELLPINQLPDLILRAELAVVPYRRDEFTDGILPTKLLEYVALGLPVLASRTTVLEEYFDGSMVRFANPGDVEDLARQIVIMANDDEARSGLIDASDRFNRAYGWSQHGPEYVGLVERVGDGTFPFQAG